MINFEEELTQLLNKFGEDANTSTPDFILARYLAACLQTYKNVLQETDEYNSK